MTDDGNRLRFKKTRKPWPLFGVMLWFHEHFCNNLVVNVVFFSRNNFLYYQNSLCNVQITSTNIQRCCTVQNRIFNRFGELWQPNDNNIWMIFRSVEGTWLTGYFFNESKYSTIPITLHVSRRSSCQLSFCSDMFTKFTIETVG